MNDAKPLDDSGRYLLLLAHVICSSNCFRWLYCVFYFCALLYHRRGGIQNLRMKKESAETEAIDQVPL